ncbi:MAG: pyridoxal-dependent decarboxylase [Wenzhouxiangellaceae bacterium]|nr:pyridoxal-dependent decarboxylase [Wenzhouxiangellaceae bacterium]
MTNATDPESLEWLNPYFLGAYAENDTLLENILVEFLRDHCFWRRNLHPEDPPLIPMLASDAPEYRQFVARMKTELHGLSAKLKNSAPFFNPRYIGHMASDLLLPGLIAQLVTTLYNPNHVTDEAAPVTLGLDLEVGLQLARMFGYSCDPQHEPCAWGHVTSGGTLANDEALWYLRAVRYWPLAARAACRQAGFEPGPIAGLPDDLCALDDWTLFNLSVDRIVDLRRTLLMSIHENHSAVQAREIAGRIEAERIECLGAAQFHAQLKSSASPCVIVPASAHYSWEKALKLLGLGSANLVTVPLNERMRMDSAALDAALAEAHAAQRPVLAVVGILGSTEFGAIDPIDRIVSARQRWRKRGLDFGIHVDAAWGGYLASIFRNDKGGLVDHAELRKSFHFFPSDEVYHAFGSLRHADSITVDPHKLGFIPFGCGAYVARNRAMTDFISQKAAYVFEADDDESEYQRRFQNLGKYIIEGSKPGAAAAAAWVTHRVLPLNHDHFGRLCSQTIRNCEYFFEHIDDLAADLDGTARVFMPFEPDTNLVCLAINPEGNRDLATMNRFGERLYERMRVGEGLNHRQRPFFGSRTRVQRTSINEQVAQRLTDALGLDPDSFTAAPEVPDRQADNVFLLRHTLMNPWVAGGEHGMNYLDRYCRYLGELVREELELAAHEQRSLQ